MKKLSLLIGLLVMSVSTLLAQTKVITGTVTSAVQGEGAIPGVTVQVLGTTIGTATDANGKYTLNVPADAKTLVFTYIGMKKLEVDIAGRSVIDAVMEAETLGLTEVVVTAFGIKRASKELGVATAQVSDKTLTQAGVSNVVNGLTAKVSGLQINTVNNGVNPDTRITLRGNRHFLASNQALIVLDGSQVSADFLNSINPNDIDNVNILKGASAAALYGNDASNGVLVITTKRGAAGGLPTVKISNITTFEMVSYMPKMQTRFGSGSGEDTVNYIPNYTFWLGPDRNTDPYTSYENQQYGPEFNGQMVILGGVLADGSYQMVPYSYVKDQKKNFFQTGVSSQNDISYSIGDEKNSFYISIQDLNKTGIVPHDRNKRTGVRVAGSRTTGIFHADYSVGYTQTYTNVSGNEYFQGRPVYWNVLNTPGEVNFQNYKDVDNNKFANWNGYFNAYYPNPYWQLKYSRYKTRRDNMLGNAFIQLSPFKWMDISYRLGLIYDAYNQNYWRDGVVYNDYMRADPWQAGGMGGSSPFTGNAYQYNVNEFILTGNFLLTLNHKFGDFGAKLILGNASYKDNYNYLYVGNNSLVIPFLYNISNRVGEPGVGQTQLDRTSIGVFGDLQLSYKDFAFIHASARNDWDSRLTKDNRSFFYPGVDASLVLTDAIQALKGNPILSFAKIRGSWSQTGQIALNNWYATLPSFNPGAGFPYGSQAGFLLSTTLSNPLILPEKTQEVEIGTELSFLKNRLHLELNAYKTNTKNQTIPANLSYATGYSNAFINAGELMTEGIETDFKLTPLVSLGPVDWNLTVTYTYQTSKVLSILPGLDQLSVADVSYAIVGQQFPSIQVTDVKRDPQGHIIVDPLTGFPIKDPALKNLGHGNPNHLLGIVSTWTWKGLSLNVVADYRSGNIIDNAVGGALDFTGSSWHSAQNGRQNFVVPNSVVNVGTVDNPVYQTNTNVITRNAARPFWVSSDYVAVGSTYVTSAAFWKIREIALTYEIPVKNILGGAVKGAQIGFVGRNLFMFRPRTNIWTDPEFNTQGGNSNAVGYTNEYQTPATRILGFSVKLTF